MHFLDSVGSDALDQFSINSGMYFCRAGGMREHLTRYPSKTSSSLNSHVDSIRHGVSNSTSHHTFLCWWRSLSSAAKPPSVARSAPLSTRDSQVVMCRASHLFGRSVFKHPGSYSRQVALPTTNGQTQVHSFDTLVPLVATTTRQV